MNAEEIRKLVRTETVHRLDYSSFEDIVKSVYGQDYSFSADEEGNNDSSYSYSAKKGSLDSWGAEDVEKFKETGEYQYLASKLIEDLVEQDLLPEGDYIIDLSY